MSHLPGEQSPGIIAKRPNFGDNHRHKQLITLIKVSSITEVLSPEGAMPQQPECARPQGGPATRLTPTPHPPPPGPPQTPCPPGTRGQPAASCAPAVCQPLTAHFARLSLDSQTHAVRKFVLLSPFHRPGFWGPERLSHSPEVTQRASSRARVQPRSVGVAPRPGPQGPARLPQTPALGRVSGAAEAAGGRLACGPGPTCARERGRGPGRAAAGRPPP